MGHTHGRQGSSIKQLVGPAAKTIRQAKGLRLNNGPVGWLAWVGWVESGKGRTACGAAGKGCADAVLSARMDGNGLPWLDVRRVNVGGVSAKSNGELLAAGRCVEQCCKPALAQSREQMAGLRRQPAYHLKGDTLVLYGMGLGRKPGIAPTDFSGALQQHAPLQAL